MAHSPTPWMLKDAELFKGVPGKAIISARGDVVAFVYHTFADVQEGNAALLHAAPKLLEACKAAQKHLVEMLFHHPHLVPDALFKQLSTAIANAEPGEASDA